VRLVSISSFTGVRKRLELNLQAAVGCLEVSYSLLTRRLGNCFGRHNAAPVNI